jgi:hypothetical protein
MALCNGPKSTNADLVEGFPVRRGLSPLQVIGWRNKNEIPPKPEQTGQLDEKKTGKIFCHVEGGAAKE